MFTSTRSTNEQKPQISAMPPPVEDNSPQENIYPYRIEEPKPPMSVATQPISHAQGEAQSSSPVGGVQHIPFLDRLKALPEVRRIPWRPGQELPPERSVDSPRVQQRGALLLVTRGKIEDEKCTHCAAGYGRFSECITMENWFQGACSGCIYTSKGNKCSLRFQTSGNVDGRALRHHVSNPDMIKELLSTAKENPSSASKKRKRRSVPTMKAQQAAADASFSSSTQPIVSDLPKSPDMDTLLQSQIARDESSGQIEYAKKPKKQKKVERLQSFPTQYQDPIISQYPSEAQYQAPYPLNSIQRAPYLQPPKRGLPNESHIEEPRNFTPVSATWQGQSTAPKSQSTPIIDVLPKVKQRHIYGLISGLQGGIDHLEKQLSSLKSLLGIEDSDDTFQP